MMTGQKNDITDASGFPSYSYNICGEFCCYLNLQIQIEISCICNSNKPGNKSTHKSYCLVFLLFIPGE